MGRETKAIFETHTGPCNDYYCFWPGLIYVLRTVLCGVTICLSSSKSRSRHLKMIVISAFCITIMFLACIFPHRVYKKWPLNVLEFSFLLNLCILCVFLGFAKINMKPMQFFSLFPLRYLHPLHAWYINLWHVYADQGNEIMEKSWEVFFGLQRKDT